MIQLIPTVVQQHAEEAVTLRTTRSYLVTAAHVQLFDLARADERLAAHLDGLAVAGDEGSKTALDAVQEDPDPGLGEFFTAMVCAIEDRNEHRLEWLLDRAEASPPSPSHGLGVLRHGYQRQRIAAALLGERRAPGRRGTACRAPTTYRAPTFFQENWLPRSTPTLSHWL